MLRLEADSSAGGGAITEGSGACIVFREVLSTSGGGAITDRSIRGAMREISDADNHRGRRDRHARLIGPSNGVRQSNIVLQM